MKYLATYSVFKMVTEFNEAAQDWSGKVSDHGVILKGTVMVDSEREALRKVQDKLCSNLRAASFEEFDGEPGRFDMNQCEDADGIQDDDGKWLADYSIYIKLYVPAEKAVA